MAPCQCTQTWTPRLHPYICSVCLCRPLVLQHVGANNVFICYMQIVLCFWFPPLAVLMHEEKFSPDVLLNILLTLLGIVVSSQASSLYVIQQTA